MGSKINWKNINKIIFIYKKIKSIKKTFFLTRNKIINKDKVDLEINTKLISNNFDQIKKVDNN